MAVIKTSDCIIILTHIKTISVEGKIMGQAAEVVVSKASYYEKKVCSVMVVLSRITNEYFTIEDAQKSN